jgi:hypothetical protein
MKLLKHLQEKEDYWLVIAKQPGPDAVKLMQQVILASASIPVAFPPVYIPVTYKNRVFHEMHVDGGVTSGVFVTGMLVDLKKAAQVAGLRKIPRINLYIIRNNHLDPSYEPVKRELFPIAERSLTSLTSTQGKGDLTRIYLISQKQGLNFNFTHIPKYFDFKPQELVDKNEMKALYKLGYERASHGIKWKKIPPRV